MINIDLQRIPVGLVRGVVHEHADILKENVSQHPLIFSVIGGKKIICPEIDLSVYI